MSSRKQKRTLPVWGIALGSAVILLVSAAFATGAQLEAHDTFCATCHTQNESTYVDRTLAPTAIDLAGKHAEKGVHCIDCHSGRGISGRLSAEVGGARNALVFLTGRDVQPHAMTRPLPDGNCIKCHTSTLRRQTFENHFHTLLARWRQVSSQAARCTDCHEGHTTDVDANIAFLNKQRTVAVCQACHLFAGE